MMLDISSIKKAAEAATQGTWYVCIGVHPLIGNVRCISTHEGDETDAICVTGSVNTSNADAVHIATANPSTVIAMCDEIERLRSEAERLQSAAWNPQLLTSEDRRTVWKRILIQIKGGLEYLK